MSPRNTIFLFYSYIHLFVHILNIYLPTPNNTSPPPTHTPHINHPYQLPPTAHRQGQSQRVLLRLVGETNPLHTYFGQLRVMQEFAFDKTSIHVPAMRVPADHQETWPAF